MKTITHLNVFDFDESLYRVPNFTCSEAKGMEPYDWFDSPNSLSDKFNIKAIENVHAAARRTDRLNYLVTHRNEDCLDIITKMLHDSSIVMKDMYFLGRKQNKAKVVEGLVLANPNLRTMTIYEDTMSEIIKYVEHFTENPVGIKIDFMFIDKSKILRFNWTIASVIAFATSERLILS